ERPRRGGAGRRADPAARRGSPLDVPRPAPLLGAGVLCFSLSALENARMALSSNFGRPGRPGAGRSLAVRTASRRRLLHLVGDPGCAPARLDPARRACPRLLGSSRPLARGGRHGDSLAGLWLRPAFLPPALLRSSSAPPALPDQVL